MKGIIHTYRKESTRSYTLGAFATIELLKARPDKAEAVYVHSACKEGLDGLQLLCRDTHTPVFYSDYAFRRINAKENTFVLCLFQV